MKLCGGCDSRTVITRPSRCVSTIARAISHLSSAGGGSIAARAINRRRSDATRTTRAAGPAVRVVLRAPRGGDHHLSRRDAVGRRLARQGREVLAGADSDAVTSSTSSPWPRSRSSGSPARCAPPPGRPRGRGSLSATAFAGAIILAAALRDRRDHAVRHRRRRRRPAPVAIQTLSAASSDFFFPFLVGIFLWLFATGLVILRARPPSRRLRVAGPPGRDRGDHPGRLRRLDRRARVDPGGEHRAHRSGTRRRQARGDAYSPSVLPEDLPHDLVGPAADRPEPGVAGRRARCRTPSCSRRRRGSAGRRRPPRRRRAGWPAWPSSPRAPRRRRPRTGAARGR